MSSLNGLCFVNDETLVRERELSNEIAYALFLKLRKVLLADDSPARVGRRGRGEKNSGALSTDDASKTGEER
ncbi:MAG: hypothetical protein ABIT01_02040 [Thermoanaerobaculia bacterium]